MTFNAFAATVSVKFGDANGASKINAVCVNADIILFASAALATSAKSTMTFDSKNYDGATFATALAAKLTTAVAGFAVVPKLICTYDNLENQLTISIDDTSTRNEATRVLYPFHLEFYTDEMLTPRYGTEANTTNTIIRNTTQTIITEAKSYVCYVCFVL